MDPISTLSGDTRTGAGVNGYSALTSEEFVKIMFSELTNQDPLKPNDSAALLEQISSLRSIESNMELERKLEDLVIQNQFSSAGSMVGAYIAGLTEQNLRVQGQVVSVSRTDKGPVLNLANGWRVPFANMDEVTDPRLIQQPPNPTPTNPTPAPTGSTGSDSAPRPADQAENAG